MLLGMVNSGLHFCRQGLALTLQMTVQLAKQLNMDVCCLPLLPGLLRQLPE